MDLIRSALLLFLLQLSPLDVHMTGEAAASVYKCTDKKTSAGTVTEPGAQLTDGCVLEDSGITFDLGAMYNTSPINPVVIDISDAAFINSYIKLINAPRITVDNVPVPLMFTMDNCKMNGTSKLEFGSSDKVFTLPPHSRIRILNSQLTISSGDENLHIFLFYSLQLVTNSSMEIAHNVITMESINGWFMNVFNILGFTEIYKESSFTLRDNEINMNGHNDHYLIQSVWYGSGFALDISAASMYTCARNIINMLGYGAGVLRQVVWYGTQLRITISDNSRFIWASNNISMVAYNVSNILRQSVWVTRLPMTIAYTSQFLLDSNRILLMAKDYGTIESSVMNISMRTSNALLDNSSMILRANCVGMGQKKADKRQVFAGNWSFTRKSKLQLDGNCFTTTAEYEPNDSELTEFVWGPSGDTVITRNDGSTLSIENTQVLGNGVTSGGTESVVWNVSLSVSNTHTHTLSMKRSSSPAKDRSGSLIPLLDNSKIQYMCGIHITPRPSVTVPKQPTTVMPEPKEPVSDKPHPKEPTTTTTTAGVKSATVISSTVPAVLISSVVFLYLYNW